MRYSTLMSVLLLGLCSAVGSIAMEQQEVLQCQVNCLGEVITVNIEELPSAVRSRIENNVLHVPFESCYFEGWLRYVSSPDENLLKESLAGLFELFHLSRYMHSDLLTDKIVEAIQDKCNQRNMHKNQIILLSQQEYEELKALSVYFVEQWLCYLQEYKKRILFDELQLIRVAHVAQQLRDYRTADDALDGVYKWYEATLDNTALENLFKRFNNKDLQVRFFSLMQKKRTKYNMDALFQNIQSYDAPQQFDTTQVNKNIAYIKAILAEQGNASNMSIVGDEVYAALHCNRKKIAVTTNFNTIQIFDYDESARIFNTMYNIIGSLSEPIRAIAWHPCVNKLAVVYNTRLKIFDIKERVGNFNLMSDEKPGAEIFFDDAMAHAVTRLVTWGSDGNHIMVVTTGPALQKMVIYDLKDGKKVYNSMTTSKYGIITAIHSFSAHGNSYWLLGYRDGSLAVCVCNYDIDEFCIGRIPSTGWDRFRGNNAIENLFVDQENGLLYIGTKGALLYTVPIVAFVKTGVTIQDFFAYTSTTNMHQSLIKGYSTKNIACIAGISLLSGILCGLTLSLAVQHCGGLGASRAR
jgi:hypothetical protein